MHKKKIRNLIDFSIKRLVGKINFIEIIIGFSEIQALALRIIDWALIAFMQCNSGKL